MCHSYGAAQPAVLNRDIKPENILLHQMVGGAAGRRVGQVDAREGRNGCSDRHCTAQPAVFNKGIKWMRTAWGLQGGLREGLGLEGAATGG